jgi:hypothetical protein
MFIAGFPGEEHLVPIRESVSESRRFGTSMIGNGHMKKSSTVHVTLARPSSEVNAMRLNGEKADAYGHPKIG